MNVYKKYSIYEDQSLNDYIQNLENKYKVINEEKKYEKLVNFSKNVDEPCSKWFRYREGFSNILVQDLIDDSKINENEILIDPFCGSGTTLLVGLKNKLNCFGMDVNPISIYLTNFKCKKFNRDMVNEYKQGIKDFYQKISSLVLTDEYKDKYSSVEKYFSTNNFKSLIIIKEYIDSIECNKELYDFFKIAYLCIIEKTSNRKRDGNGLKTVETKINDVFQYFIDTLNCIIQDIETTLITNSKNSTAILDTAENLKIEYGKIYDKKAKCIIFSPPYANSFDYFESYKLEIVLCDFAKDMKEINKYRKKAISSFVGTKKYTNEYTPIIKIAKEIENKIEWKENFTGKKDSRTRKVPNMLKGYFSDMENVISNCSDTLEKNGKAYIVVDQSSYIGKVVPTDLLLCDLAEKYDFEVEKIIVCRKARTSSQQIRLFPYLNDILRESILVLNKKGE